MSTPAFADLADRADVWRRQKTERVDADRFADLRPKVESMTWAVGAVVTDDEDRVLLVEEDGQWLAPGGEVEPGETLEVALVREIREETGIEIRVERPVAATEVSFVHDGERASFYFAHYLATPEGTTLADDPGTDDEDIEAVAWVADVPKNTVDREVIDRFR